MSILDVIPREFLGAKATLEVDGKSLGIAAKVVANDDRYTIIDVDFAGATASVTRLKADQETRGHKHPNAETYLFLTRAKLQLGEEGWWIIVGPATGPQVVPGDVFHKVKTFPGETAEFICLFEGRREDKR